MKNIKIKKTVYIVFVIVGLFIVQTLLRIFALTKISTMEL